MNVNHLLESGSKHAEPAVAVLVLQQPHAATHVLVAHADEHLHMRARQLRNILWMMEREEGADVMLRLAYDLAMDLAEDIAVGMWSLGRPTQLARLLEMIQGDDAPDDTLWLAQQFAFEILAGLTAVQGIRDAAKQGGAA